MTIMQFSPKLQKQSFCRIIDSLVISPLQTDYRTSELGLKYSRCFASTKERSDFCEKSGLGMTCRQQPVPVLPPAQIKKKEV